MKIFRNKRHSCKGFTLVEILIAVAIVAILTAIAIPSISAISRSLHQKQLDDYAQSVYLAAQDHLVSLRKDGTISKFLNEGDYPQVPAEDNASFPYENSIHRSDVAEERVTEYAVISSDSAHLAEVLPAGSVDEVVYSGYAFLIEFNRYTGDVYSVFLTDNGKNYFEDGYANLNALNTDSDLRENGKLRRRNNIGYYEGSLVLSGEHISKDNSYGTFLEFDNGQEFLAKIYVPVPDGKAPGSFEKSITSVKLSVTGLSSGNPIVIDVKSDTKQTTAGHITEENSDSVLELVYTIPLQSLLSENDYGLDQSPNNLWYGENISAMATVTSVDVDIEPSNIVGGNPWFSTYDSATGTVFLANGRHLQNLSGISKEKMNFTEVSLSKDIDWQKTQEYYGNPTMSFIPLDNNIFSEATFSFDGGGTTISNLYIDDSGNSDTGLFRTFNTIAKNLTIENPAVQSTQSGANVGAFAGTLETAAKLEGISVRVNKSGAVGSSGLNWGISGSGGNVGLFVGQNKGGEMRELTVSAVSVSSTSALPVSGDNFGLIAGSNSGSIGVSSLKAELMNGQAAAVGGVAGMNTGTVDVKGTYSLTVNRIAGDTFGGVAGRNSGTLSGSGIIVNANISDSRIDSSGDYSDPYVFGGVVGRMEGGRIFGFSVGSTGNEGIIVTASNRAVNFGGIIGRLTASASYRAEEAHEEDQGLFLENMKASITTSSKSNGEAHVGGLIGYAATAVQDALLTYKNTTINVFCSQSNAYVGGLVGNELTGISNVQLNSAKSQNGNKICVKTFSNAFAAGIAGNVGGDMSSAKIVADETAPFVLELGENGSNIGTAYVGGLVSCAVYDGKTGSGMDVSNSSILVDDLDQSGADSVGAKAMRLTVNARKAYVGGIVPQLNGGTVSACKTEGVDIEVNVGSDGTVYAGGAVGYNNDGNLGGELLNGEPNVSVAGSLTLKRSGSEKYAGGAVGAEKVSENSSVYTNVEASVSLAGWGSGAAGTLYEDPSRQGVNVGQFIGSVYNGKFSNCSSKIASGSYQFLGKIYCKAEGEVTSGKYYFLDEMPTQDKLNQMAVPFRQAPDYNSEATVAAYYGLRLADNFASHAYHEAVSLQNCTYLSGSTVYDQVITGNESYRFLCKQDKGHYVFEPIVIDMENGFKSNSVWNGYKEEATIFIYDVDNHVLMSCPAKETEAGALLGKTKRLTGYRIDDQGIAFKNGILYKDELERLNGGKAFAAEEYGWTIGLSDKFGSIGIFDSDASRIFLRDRASDYMVPYFNFGNDIYFFNDTAKDLLNVKYPEQMYLKEVVDGSKTYQLTRRGQTAIGVVAEGVLEWMTGANWSMDASPRLIYQNGTYQVGFGESRGSNFQFFSYKTVADVSAETAGWYFLDDGQCKDTICSSQLHSNS